MRPSLSLPRSRPRRLTVELVVLALIFAFGGFAGPALAAQVTQVLVMNTSSNPVPVAGTVNVGNLPASQAVTGTVNVGNFPTSQNVNVTGGSVTAAQKVSTVLKGTGFHAVDFAQGDTFNLGASGFNVTGIAIDDGLSEQDTWRLNIFGVPSGAIKIASGSGNYFIALPQPILASAIHAQCLSQAGCFWSIEVTGYPTE
jgi:hypothetical protein